MKFSNLLEQAVRRHAGRPESSDSVSFQLAADGKVACFVNGLGATAATPRKALEKALKTWRRLGRGGSNPKRRVVTGDAS